MQCELELIAVSNDKKFAVISGFIFLLRSFACFNCHFSGHNFGYYISSSLVVGHLAIQSFSGLSS